MAWVIILALGLAVGLALRRWGGFRGPLLQLLAATLLVGMAGYAWQGRPGLPGAPKGKPEVEAAPANAFAELRDSFFERFNYASHWLILSDSYLRRGNSKGAVDILRSGLRASPNNVALWTGLGHALTVHGDGSLNPAADHAYRRARSVAPAHPAPVFFYGLSLMQSGRIEEGEREWRTLLASAPPRASWRPLIEERLAVIDQLRAMGRLPPAA